MLTDVIIYGLLAGAATMIGVGILLMWEEWARKNSIIFISLAAGILLSVAFLHILPEAVKLSDSAFLFVILGFLIFYLLEQNIMLHSCVEGECTEHTFSMISLSGLTIHSFLDGLAIGVGFGVNYALGITAAVGILFHEFPEGITVISILFHAKIERKKAIFYSFIVAVATPLGAILTFLFIKNIPSAILGNLLALSVGSFIYIAASDLVPQTHKKFQWLNIFAFVFGIAFMYLIKICL